VGTLLNLINQPQLFLSICLNDLNTLRDINYLKVFLTSLVPYFVSLYGALSVLDIPIVNNQNQTRQAISNNQNRIEK